MLQRVYTIYIFTNITHTHTHTHIYIYIYVYVYISHQTADIYAFLKNLKFYKLRRNLRKNVTNGAFAYIFRDARKIHRLINFTIEVIVQRSCMKLPLSRNGFETDAAVCRRSLRRIFYSLASSGVLFCQFPSSLFFFLAFLFLIEASFEPRQPLNQHIEARRAVY